MGNIIKFNLDSTSDIFEEVNIEKWKRVQDDFINKYGLDEIKATYKIVEEIGVSNAVDGLIKSFGTKMVENVLKSNNLEKLIVNYADHRVSPDKITSLKDRIEDQHERFLKSMSKENALKNIKDRKHGDDLKYKLEKKLFENLKINPDEIKDISIDKITNEFLEIEL